MVILNLQKILKFVPFLYAAIFGLNLLKKKLY